MSTVYYTHNTSAIYPAYITWNQQSSSSHVTISLIHHFSTITGSKALSTSLSAMSPDSSQPIAIIIYYRPHGLFNMLSNEQPLIPDHGSRLTLPKLPREPTGCASPGAAGGTQCPSPCPRLCHVLLSYCVWCFAILVIRYPRTKTYKPRGRASDVSTISTCFSYFCHDLLPTPPPISVRKAGGITVVYLCGF